MDKQIMSASTLAGAEHVRHVIAQYTGALIENLLT